MGHFLFPEHVKIYSSKIIFIFPHLEQPLDTIWQLLIFNFVELNSFKIKQILKFEWFQFDEENVCWFFKSTVG